jgi:Spy/CpxP family protein refolding chaperone
MRTVKTTLTALALAALVASPAWAQGRGRFGPGMLLTNKSVQEELKADDAQKDKMKDLADDVAGKTQEAFQSLGNLQDLEPAERMKKIQETMKPITDEMNKSLDKILKPEQAKRFKEISLQSQGARAFANPELQSELKLTDDQKKKIQEFEQEAGEKRREIFQNAGDDRAAAFEKMIALNKETLEKVVGTLNDDQKKTWKDKTGKPFDVKYEPPPGN